MSTIHAKKAKQRVHVQIPITSRRVRHIFLLSGVGVGIAIGASILMQIAYPRSMTLPQTRIGGRAFGFTSRASIEAEIAKLNDQQLTIRAGDQVFKHRPADVGVRLDGSRQATQATAYSWRQRLTPFLFFLQRRDMPTFDYALDEAKASAFAQGLVQHNKPAANAVVKLDGTQVVVERAQTGYSYDPGTIVKGMKQLQLNRELAATIQPTAIQPDVSDTTAGDVAKQLRQRLSVPLKVEVIGKSITFDEPIIASWTVLTPDPATKNLLVSFDREKVKGALGAWANQVYVPAIPNSVSVVDNAPVASTAGAEGQALAVDASTDAVITALAKNEGAAAAKTVPLPSPARVNRGYTRSSKGIQALIDYWSQTNSGQWGIVVRDFGGSISASHNPNRQFTSASVYKIFVAYIVYSKIDSGEFTLNTPTPFGNTVGGCLELMVVRSDNGCGHALGEMIGWGANNDALRAKGMGSTSLNNGSQLTTAQDTSTYLFSLQNGTLMSPGNTAAMLEKMRRGIWRYAIPAGISGVPVANKLGVVGNFSHDIAIVYHPKGAFVLSVMSYGSSHARIRELAREINSVMNQ